MGQPDTLRQLANQCSAAERDRDELAAALRNVTANFRGWLESDVRGRDDAAFEKVLERYGVLEAEALLKRIDEGTP